MGQLLSRRLISFLDPFLRGLCLPAEIKFGENLGLLNWNIFPMKVQKTRDQVWSQEKS